MKVHKDNKGVKVLISITHKALGFLLNGTVYPFRLPDTEKDINAVVKSILGKSLPMDRLCMSYSKVKHMYIPFTEYDYEKVADVGVEDE